MNEEKTIEEVATTPPAPKTAKMFAVDPNVIQAVMTYLDTKPHNEVANLIQNLKTGGIIDVTITYSEPTQKAGS